MQREECQAFIIIRQAFIIIMALDILAAVFAAPEPDGPCAICHFAVPFFLVPSSPPAGCGGPALLHSAHHVINTPVSTPLGWQLTRCHRVLPS